MSRIILKIFKIIFCDIFPLFWSFFIANYITFIV